MLPDDFLWGTATSAHQVEGHNTNDWSDFERKRGLVRSGAASAFSDHLEADLDRARALGTNAFRFSIEWSRIEPEPGRPCREGLDFYHRLIDACVDRGLTPMVTLVQFTLPRWCRGGWLDPDTHAAFLNHARRVATHFGDRVGHYITFNEPNIQASAGYVAGVFPPGKRLRPDLADRCEAKLIKTHAAARHHLIETTLKHHPQGRQPRVGVAPHTIAWRKSRWDPFGLVWRHAERFNWGFLDALHTGQIRLGAIREAVPQIQGALDFVGMNHFMGLSADLVGAMRFAGVLRRPVTPHTSDMGWPIDPKGFERTLLEAHRRYKHPIHVTENGLADANDTRRAAYLRDHIAALCRAADAGVQIDGYFHWSLIDNFEWQEGFGPRFGLYAVDYETQSRTARPSAAVYARLIQDAARNPKDPHEHRTTPRIDRRMETTVAIVGGGLVGCALAAALADRGFEVTVLERSREIPDVLRGELIMPAGVAILEGLGLGEALGAVGFKTEGVVLHHPAFERGQCAIDYAMAPAPLDEDPALWRPRGLCGWRKDLYGALRAALGPRRGVHLVEGFEVGALRRRGDGGWWVESKTGVRIGAQLVVGADGASSKVRRLRGFVPGHDRRETVVQGFVGRSEGWRGRRVHVGVHDLGAVFVFPFPKGHFRTTFEYRADFRDLMRGPDALQLHLRALEEALPEVWSSLGGRDIEVLGPLQVQPGRDMVLGGVVEDGLALVGDAAGCLDPFTGFGMTLGLMDAVCLADVLASSGDFQAPSLRRYEARRACGIAQRREATDWMSYLFLDKSEGFAEVFAARVAERWRDRDWILPQIAAQFAGYDPIVSPSVGMKFHMMGLL